MARDNLKIQVRGIYSSALVKLLLDNGFQIVNPSVEIEERFRITQKSVEADITVNTRRDQQGIIASGDRDAVRIIGDVIAIELNESILRQRTSGNLDVEFPLSMKARLDRLRRKVTPTMDNHHYYKAFGGEVAALVDMAERLIDRGKPREVVEDDFMRTLLQYIPFEGSRIEISHVKLNGSVIPLGKATLELLDGAEIRYSRSMSAGGKYDGLGIPKEGGDKAITHIHKGDYHYTTEYFSSNGSLKGTYININTPIEVYRDSIRYIDLEVDVVVWRDGAAEIIDLDKLEQMEQEGVITSHLAKKAEDKAKSLLTKHLET
ncbi:MAG: DUF402 domain-containing protein [Candidatus Bathyarchaeia archaeon]